MYFLFNIRLLIAASLVYRVAAQAREYDMDELATCGRTLNVDDSGIRLHARGNTSPSNPPTNCIVYLRSVYARDDGSNKLQIEVESLNIKDCNVRLDLYNGRTSVGNTLRAMSCQGESTSIIYSTGREVTVRLSRPDVLVHNEYQFTLFIKPYKDRDVPGTASGVDALPVGAIIGIVVGCLILIALIILFLWCCCTGRLGNFNVPGRPLTKAGSKSDPGISNAGMMTEKPKPAVDLGDSVVWNTTNGTNSTRLYQKGMPRNAMRNFGRDNNGSAGPPRYSQHRRSGDEYEQYEWDERQRQAREADERRRREEEERRRQPRKETLIDDVFDSESDKTDETLDDATLQKRPPGGSPKSKRKGDIEVPEEKDLDKGSPQLQRYLSMDLQSQPDQDTISSPLHINAGVRASVEDIEGGSPGNSLRRKKKGNKSPKSKRKKDGKEPDPMAPPPEALEPIFTAPISGVGYTPNQPQAGYGFPGYPYGMIPAGFFASGVPGTQTYAYAYQTAAPGGVPTQGAWLVQNTPTTDGNRRTAYVVEETKSPDKSRTSPGHRRKNSDPFRRMANRDSDRSRRGHIRGDDSAPDLSVIARGAAPPDPGQGHRSIAMKSGPDPDTGMHTTQVVWTDTVPDKTDPKPGENPQITRKTVTRVTTRSGYGEIPPETDPLLALNDPEPAFLSPSKPQHSMNPHQASILPAAQTPDNSNIDYYTGATGHHTVPPPERTSTPTSIHHQPSAYSHAIRDRIPLDDSTV